MNIKLFLVILGVYLFVDFIWLSSTTKLLYKQVVKAIQNSDIKLNVNGAVVAYLLLAIGIYYFVLEEGKNTKNKDIYPRSILFGLLGYGIFNGKNNAIFQDWNYKISTIDTLWGMTGSTIVSILSNIIIKKI